MDQGTHNALKDTAVLEQDPQRIVHPTVERVHGPEEVVYGMDELVVLCLVRDGRPFVRGFVEHYSSMGVKHMVFLDNGSTDGTVEALEGYDNVTVLRSTLPFREYKNWMRRYLLGRFGRGRWSLYADIDELFDYPYSDIIGLDSLLGYLNSNSYTAVVAQMLDMVPEKPLADRAGSLDEPTKELHRFYDISHLIRKSIKEHPNCPPGNTYGSDEIEHFQGGVRLALFGAKPGLTKHPLVFLDGKVQPMSPHSHWHGNVAVADFTCALFHYKFLDGYSHKQATQAVLEKQYSNDSQVYKKTLEVLGRNPGLLIKGETARELKSVNDLVENGFLVVSEEYMMLAYDRERKGAGHASRDEQNRALHRAKAEAKVRGLRIQRLERQVEALREESRKRIGEHQVQAETLKSRLAKQREKNQKLTRRIQSITSHPEEQQIKYPKKFAGTTEEQADKDDLPRRRRRFKRFLRRRVRKILRRQWARKILILTRGAVLDANRKIENQAQAPSNTQRRTNEQRKMLEKRKRRQLSTVQGLNSRLHRLGFTEPALEDLRRLAADDARPVLKKLAAWELCVWYAGQRGEEDARRCLALLPAALQGEKDATYLRRAAILEAECQEAVGNIEAARLAISHALASEPHADLLFAKANLEASASAKIEWVNSALQLHGLSRIALDASPDQTLLDSLRPEQDKGDPVEASADPKVSVIMPVYNAEGVIRTALDSVLAQTWTNLEVLVVDDRGTDATVPIVEDYARSDPRVQLIRARSNGGTYIARNLGLRAATGALVTCHDADDWSHPEKIEKQVRHLLRNPEVVGNLSEHARVTPDLRFNQRGRPTILMRNLSSLMFRREPVMEAVGYWDSVRFAGDDEFLIRARAVFGKERVVVVPTGPLSFVRQSGSTLTGNEAFGTSQHWRLGIRGDYFESYTHYHATAKNLRYEFPQESRPFAVPEPMWSAREARGSERRHFDVILASDLRLPGGATVSNVEEIKAQKRMGIRTGLIQMSRYDLDPGRPIDHEVRGLLDGDRTQMLVYGEKVSCDALIIRGPASLQEWQRFVPDVKAANVHVIVDETPMSHYGDQGRSTYTIGRCEKHLREHFGKAGVWHPVDPLVREALYQYHAEELTEITLANEDWPNIIDVEEWGRDSRPPRGPKPRIGRYSRDHDGKWPGDPGQLLDIYPGSGDYEVHVMGGAKVPRQTLGSLPESWHVQEFGKLHPRDFLSTLDIFIYYAHPDLAEALDRSIIEAMAAGVPVILPHGYQELFREAAIYAKPSEVKKNIDQLMDDDDYYESRVRIARAYVKAHFGYTLHATRLGKQLGASP